MRKSTVLLLMLGMSAAPLLAEGPSSSEIDVLKKQIEALQKQLETISKQVNAQSKQVKEIKAEAKPAPVQQPTAPATTVVQAEPKKDEALVFDKGYIPVPGTKAAVKIEGLLRLDAAYDGNNTSGDFTAIHRLPYNLQARNPNFTSSPQAYNFKKHFDIHAKQTRIGLKSVVKNNSGKDVLSFIELDFFGGAAMGDQYPAFQSSQGNGAGSIASLTYAPRLRHATLTYGGLMVGHTWTNFNDMLETLMPTVDVISLNAPTRHAQVRYTHKFDKFEAAIAAEQPRADYITYNSNPTATNPNYVYIESNHASNQSKPQRPDLTLSLKYKADNGSMLGVAMLVRDMTIKNNNTSGNNVLVPDGRTYKTSAYGFNIAAKLMTRGKSYITTGVTFGKGIGWYIFNFTGRSALFDISDSANGHRTYKAIPMSIAWLGYTHVWNDQWQTNFGGAMANLSSSGSTYNRPVNRWFDPGIDSKMNRVCFNTIYSPEENLVFGLEYVFVQRKSVLRYKGTGSRYQFGAGYKF